MIRLRTLRQMQDQVRRHMGAVLPYTVGPDCFQDGAGGWSAIDEAYRSLAEAESYLQQWIAYRTHHARDPAPPNTARAT